jgi:hypothetical protein
LRYLLKDVCNKRSLAGLPSGSDPARAHFLLQIPNMLGTGKYDKWAETCCKQLKARAVMIMVIDGIEGTGGSMKAPIDVMVQLPLIFRLMADEIERDIYQQAKRQANN